MLFYRGRQNIVDENGDAVPGALATFYLTGTNTLAPIYTTVVRDTPHSNPVVASDTGFLPPIYLDPSITYRVVITDANGAAVPDGVVDPIVQTALDQSGFNTLLLTSDPFKRTAAEIAAGVTPSSYVIPSHASNGIFDIQRYGAAAGADNTAAIVAANAVAALVGFGTIKLTVSGLLSTWVVFTANDVQIDGCGCSQQFATGYAKGAAGPDWAPYNQMFVVNADRVYIHNVRFLGNTVGATANYFAGSFVWFAQGISGGGVENCYFQNLRYDPTTNSVAIQVRNTAADIHLHHNKFVNCTGCISHQGSQGSVHHNTCQATDSAALAALSASPGTFDQPIGIDGSTGISVHDNKCYSSSGAPFSPAIIGANSNTTNFQIYANHIYGIHAAVAIFIRSSSNGKVFGNIIDGLGYTSVGSWCFLRVDVDSSNVDVIDNTLRGPLVAGVGSGQGLDIYTSSNTCKDNRVLFGTNTAAASLLHIGKATNPATSVFEGNYFQGGGVGTNVDMADNILASTGIEVPIIHRGNIFDTPVTTPYNCTGASRQIKFYTENDQILSTAYAPTANILPPRVQQMFRAGLAANFGFKVGVNLDIHGVEVPSGANYYLATYETGDVIHHAQTVAGGTEGWKCTTGGTIPDGTPYSQAGTSTSGDPTITVLANTTKVLVGDYISPSTGFASTGPFKVIAVTPTTITVNVNANANASPTVTHFAPVFKPLASVAA